MPVDVTRGLLPYAVGRNTVELVTLVINIAVMPAGDGSYTYFKAEGQVKARVIALTDSEIVRYAEGGITLNQGFSVALTGELVKAPDKVIRSDGTILTVVRYTIEEGASVMLCDMAPLGNDGPSYQSGYVP